LQNGCPLRVNVANHLDNSGGTGNPLPILQQLRGALVVFITVSTGSFSREYQQPSAKWCCDQLLSQKNFHYLSENFPGFSQSFHFCHLAGISKHPLKL
jgi:hypothetical protein